MAYSRLFLIAILVLAASCATRKPSPPPDRELSFSEEVGLYSEDVLRVRGTPDGAVAVGSDDCEIDDELRAEFDDLLPISAAAARRAEKRHAPFGLPVPEVDNGLELILHHKEYLIGYNTDLKQPVYALYRLDKRDVVKADRFDCFREDHRLDEDARSTLADYDEPKFDRGHLVPAGDMNRKLSTSVNTFYLSNMMPQSARFNRGVWKFLESATRMWAAKRGRVYVLSGPLFDRDGDGERDAEADARRIEFERRVGEPTHFFKILLHERNDGFIESMTFILPHTFQSVGDSEPYVIDHLRTIDEVEAMAGYDFLAGLPDHVEAALEAFEAHDIWDRR